MNVAVIPSAGIVAVSIVNGIVLVFCINGTGHLSGKHSSIMDRIRRDIYDMSSG